MKYSRHSEAENNAEESWALFICDTFIDHSPVGIFSSISPGPKEIGMERRTKQDDGNGRDLKTSIHTAKWNNSFSEWSRKPDNWVYVFGLKIDSMQEARIMWLAIYVDYQLGNGVMKVRAVKNDGPVIKLWWKTTCIEMHQN